MEPYYGRPIPKYPCSAIVYKDGNKVIARDMDGKLIAKGTAGVDDASVIQSALDSLTPNRTWKEKVVLIGNFTLSPREYIGGWGYYSVFIPDYTSIEGINCYITYDNQGKGETHRIFATQAFKEKRNGYEIEIKGIKGELNKKAHALINLGVPISSGAYLYNITVKNILVSGAVYYGIALGRCRNITVENIIGDSNGRGTIYIGGCHGGHVKNIQGSNAIGDATTNPEEGNCMFIGDGSTNISVDGIYTYNNACQGIVIDSLDNCSFNNIICNDEIVGLHISEPRNINISNININIKQGNSSKGLYFNNFANQPEPSDIKIINGSIVGNGLTGYGIYFDSPSGNTISKVLINSIQITNVAKGIYDKSQVVNTLNIHNCIFDYIRDNAIVTNSNYIEISNCIFKRISPLSNNTNDVIDISGAKNVTISLNHIFTTLSNKPRYGITMDSTTDTVKIINNTLENLATAGINPAGVNLIIRQNIGYTTENHGTATITGDGSTTTFTIPHGLVSTPNYVNVIPKGNAPKPDSIDWDATNITLTFSTAPASGTYYYAWEARI